MESKIEHTQTYYQQSLSNLKKWIDFDDYEMAESEYNRDGNTNLLQLAIQNRDLPVISYLMNLDLFQKRSLFDKATWATIHQCLVEEEARFANFQNFGYFHQQFVHLIHERLYWERQNQLVKKFGIFGFAISPAVVIGALAISPHLLKMISSGVQTVVYLLQAVVVKFFYKPKIKNDVDVDPELLFKNRFPTTETTKAKEKITKQSNRLYSYTSLAYGLTATALVFFTAYGAPALIKIGQTALSSVLSFGLMTISGVLMAGAELWMVRNYYLKIQEDRKNFQIDLAKINEMIKKGIDEDIPKSKILNLEYQRKEIISYYETQIKSNQLSRNASIIGAAFFAVMGISAFIPVLAPFALPIAGIALAGWLAAKLISVYKIYQLNQAEQKKLSWSSLSLEINLRQLEENQVENSPTKGNIVELQKEVLWNQNPIYKSEQLPSKELVSENKNLFFADKENQDKPKTHEIVEEVVPGKKF